MRAGSPFLLRQNHEQNGEQDQRHTQGHMERERLLEKERADEDGRQGFKNAQDGGLGGTYRLGRSRQGDCGDGGRENGQTQHIQPTAPVGNGIEAQPEA